VSREISAAFFEDCNCDGEIIFKHACKLGCEGIVSKRLGSPYRSGRSPHWVKVKNPKAPAVKREDGAAESCTLWLRSKGVSAWLGEKYPPQL
jgi:ATP-dependent DNA ligase